MSDVIVLDNGGGFIKAGFAGRLDPSAVVPNCLGRPIASKKWLIADQVFSCEDLTSITLRRPIDRGYLINFDLQKEIWDRIFHQTLQVDPASSPLLLVEPLFNLPSIQRATDEVIFEDFGFKSLYIADSPSLTHMYEVSRHAEGLPAKTQCSLVVDCGFSFTHAAPVLQNFTLKYAVKRIDLGGKALTNYLKELISYRSVNVMDETFIIDDVKEKLCFVSLDVRKDLQIARKLGKDNPIKCTYVLPDGINNTKGFVKDPVEAQRYIDLMEYGLHSQPKTHEDTNLLESREKCEGRTIDLTKNEFSLTNERFLVPEMIFHPADLGMNQAGLAECIVRSVNSCHPHLRPVLFESIILTGGSTMFPHFAKRLEMELRPLVPDDYQVKITTQKDPILSVWRGGSLFASTPDFDSMCVTKAEYEELGSARCRRRFFQ